MRQSGRRKTVSIVCWRIPQDTRVHKWFCKSLSIVATDGPRSTKERTIYNLVSGFCVGGGSFCKTVTVD